MSVCSGFRRVENNGVPDISEGDKAFNALNSVLVDNPLYNEFIDLYGGGYIDPFENAILYVYYRNDLNMDLLATLKEEDLLQGHSIVFLPCQYSYTQLCLMQNDIWNYKIAHENENNHWTTYLNAIGIDQSSNRLHCIVSDEARVSCGMETVFENYPVEYLISNNYVIEQQTTIHPGYELSYGGGGMSLGFRCKKNGVSGFLTTIHNSTTGGTVYCGGNSLGTVTVSVNDGYADFTFVKLTNSNYSISRYPKANTSYQLHSSNYAVSLPANYTVYMAGRTHSYIVSGVIKYADYSVGYGTHWLACSYSSDLGDSGGCVFAKVNGDYVVLAIHDGRIYDPSTEMYLAYSTKYTTIKSYYNDITLY